ncbi:MAG: TIGR03915 family putative DNA repair protein [Bacillota bacterium]|nr:TIGR03915 family putative DNA repair protein [Bacillota bacterium]
MIDYLYDGTFEGLLTCVYHHYYTDKALGVFDRDEYQASMLNGFMEVETDSEKAMKVYDAIEQKISLFVLRQTYRAFLCNDPAKGTKILNYLVLGFRCGNALGSLHGHQYVYEVESMIKKVKVEKERMLQFVRFQAMEDKDGVQILYAEVEPDNDVIELIGDHFADRFKHDPFIIRDIGRGKAIIASEGHWYITPFEGKALDRNGVVMPNGEALHMTREEKLNQNLWRSYFEHIAIKERANSRCQRNHMPERYWKHLTEMKNVLY